MNEKEAIDALRQVREVFKKYDINFWLNGGTLLGIVRNKHLIPWDNDIDLGVWKKDVNKIKIGSDAYKDFQKKGCDVYFLKDKIVIEKNKFPINISLFYIKGDEAIKPKYLLYGKHPIGKFLRSLWWLCTVSYYGNMFKTKKTFLVRMIQILLPSNFRKNLGKIIAGVSKYFDCKEITWRVPSHFFTNLSEIKFSGMKLKAPSEIEEYLKFHYGEDWKTPKKEWDTLTQDGAIQKSRD
jgi:lipopolysaccharide cholinephosphotransferase